MPKLRPITSISTETFLYHLLPALKHGDYLPPLISLFLLISCTPIYTPSAPSYHPILLTHALFPQSYFSFPSISLPPPHYNQLTFLLLPVFPPSLFNLTSLSSLIICHPRLSSAQSHNVHGIQSLFILSPFLIHFHMKPLYPIYLSVCILTLLLLEFVISKILALLFQTSLHSFSLCFICKCIFLTNPVFIVDIVSCDHCFLFHPFLQFNTLMSITNSVSLSLSFFLYLFTIFCRLTDRHAISYSRLQTSTIHPLSISLHFFKSVFTGLAPFFQLFSPDP